MLATAAHFLESIPKLARKAHLPGNLKDQQLFSGSSGHSAVSYTLRVLPTIDHGNVASSQLLTADMPPSDHESGYNLRLNNKA